MKAKSEACSPGKQKKKKGEKKRRVQKYLQEGRKVKERKCERGPIPRPPGCRKKNGCAIAALYVVVINVIGKVSCEVGKEGIW